MFEITKERLYPYVSDSLMPVVFTVVYVLMFLYFEFTGQSSNNPMVIFSMPLLFLIVFLPRETPKILAKVLAYQFDTLRSKVVIIISIPISILVGYGLSLLSTAKGGIMPMALYPFSVASTNIVSANSWAAAMASVVGVPAILLYFTVATGEESMRLIMMKHIANKLYPGLKYIALIIITAWVIATACWASMHWFAYGGFAKPALYLSLMFLGLIWTLLGIGFGILAYGTKDLVNKMGTKSFSLVLLAYCGIPPIISHLAYDVFLSSYMNL